MKSQFLMLSAAGFLIAGAAHAADRYVDEYLQRTSAAAVARVTAAGVDLGAQSLAVQARVGGDGRLGGIHVIRSSGSLETDTRATQALRRLTVANPPPGLIGAQVKVSLGETPIVQAKAN